MKKLIVFAAGLFFALSLFAESRNALLIANGKYKNFGSLTTPVSEAKSLKKALEKLDFKVTLVENCNREKINDALYDFQTKLEKSGGIGFFHYGGHAVQVNGKNYLIPVDADIPDERRVASRAVDVDEVMASMQADTNIVILDACRNNPLPASSGRTAKRGLVITEFKPKNSIIVYSAQPGKVAQDGIFTPILTEKLLEKKEFGAILRDVRNAVSTRTNGEQSPGEYNELITDVYLAGYNVQNPVTKDDVKQIEIADYSNNETNTSDNLLEIAKKALEQKMYSIAFENFMSLAKQNYAEAQYFVGKLYETGYGVKQDFKKAKKWYEKAASQNNTEACIRLGFFYENCAFGFKYNIHKAEEYYEKAILIAENNGKTPYSLVHAYYFLQELTDMGLNKSPITSNAQVYLKKIMALHESEANNDNPDAYMSLCSHYLYGDYGIIPQDYAKAKKYYENAKKLYEKEALNGNTKAQSALGTIYLGNRFHLDYSEEKIGEVQDFEKAKYWFEMAASENDLYALINLGLIYRDGKGVSSNYTESKVYFERAEKEALAHGDKYQKNYVHELIKSLKK